MIIDLRPPQKILKATTSMIKKVVSSKRQRDGDDSDDEDYAPNPSDMAATSSIGGVGDDSSEEDIEGEEDDITALMGLSLPSRQWTAESYSIARSINQFHQQSDTNFLYFNTQVQQDAYSGYMVKKIVFKHQTIELAYMRSQPVMIELVDRFEQMGLVNFLQHRCDWNETVICQFYATLEISMEEEENLVENWDEGVLCYLCSICCSKLVRL